MTGNTLLWTLCSLFVHMSVTVWARQKQRLGGGEVGGTGCSVYICYRYQALSSILWQYFNTWQCCSATYSWQWDTPLPHAPSNHSECAKTHTHISATWAKCLLTLTESRLKAKVDQHRSKWIHCNHGKAGKQDAVQHVPDATSGSLQIGLGEGEEWNDSLQLKAGSCPSFGMNMPSQTVIEFSWKFIHQKPSHTCKQKKQGIEPQDGAWKDSWKTRISIHFPTEATITDIYLHTCKNHCLLSKLDCSSYSALLFCTYCCVLDLRRLALTIKTTIYSTTNIGWPYRCCIWCANNDNPLTGKNNSLRTSKFCLGSIQNMENDL